MRKVLYPLAIVAAALAAPSFACADEATDVVKKAIEATGGEKVIEKYKAAFWKAEGKASVMGMELDYNGTWYVQHPGKYRFDLAMNIMGQDFTLIQVLDGRKAGIKLADQPTMELTGPQLEMLKQESRIDSASRLVPLLKDTGNKLSIVGEEKVEGRPAVGVNVTHKDGLDVNMYFDKETHLLVKLTYQGKDETGAEVSQSVVFSDYKPVSGVKVPYSARIYRDGSLFVTAKVTEIDLKEEIDEQRFQKP